jgi:hypothetical protein
MAKRSTRIEVTKVYTDGHTEVNLNKNKMNKQMCEQVVERLANDWEKVKDNDKTVKEVIFRCVD